MIDLKRFRLENGISQMEICELLGVKQLWKYHIEIQND